MSKCCTPLLAGISILGASYMIGHAYAGYKKPKTEVEIEIENKPESRPETEIKEDPFPDFYDPIIIGGIDLSINRIWNSSPSFITATVAIFSTAVGFVYVLRPAYDAILMLGRLRDTILRIGEQTTNINRLTGQINEIQNNIRLTAEAQRQRINQQYNINIQAPEEEILNQVQKIKESIDLQPKYGEEFKRLKEQLNDLLNNDKAELDDIRKIKKQLEDLKNKDLGQLKDTMDKINLNIDTLQKNIRKEETEKSSIIHFDREGNRAMFGTSRTITELESKNPNNINSDQLVKDLDNTIGIILDENIIQKPKTIEQLKLEMREIYLKKDDELFKFLKDKQKVNEEQGIREEITEDEERIIYIELIRYFLFNKNKKNTSGQTLTQLLLEKYKNNLEVLNLINDILKIENYNDIPNNLLKQYANIVMKYIYEIYYGKNTKGDYKTFFYRAGQGRDTIKRPGFDRENKSKKTEQSVYRGNYRGALNAYARDYYLNRDNPIQLLQLYVSLQNLLLLKVDNNTSGIEEFIIRPDQFDNMSIDKIHFQFKKLYDYIDSTYNKLSGTIPIIISDY